MAERPIPPASLRLLRQIAEHDDGAGVHFTHAPCGRWRHPHTGTGFADRTFHPLDSRALIDIGDGHNDPVRVTSAGRAYLAAWAEAGRG